ncbi:MAG: transposase [Candidatus Methanofastidiosia archaeon]
MDREFFNVPHISVLEELNLKYLMPAKKNEKIKRIIKECKDFPALMPYEMTRQGKTVEFTLVLVKDKKGIVRAFATTLPIEVSQAETLFDLYGNRWSIETSYSMLGEVRVKTASVTYAVRWFCVLFGLLLRNGYYLFNDIVKKVDHVTLITFSELVMEIAMKKDG